jgi:hypothetical protein
MNSTNVAKALFIFLYYPLAKANGNDKTNSLPPIYGAG